MDLASAEAEIRHVFGDTPITEASIGAAPPGNNIAQWIFRVSGIFAPLARFPQNLNPPPDLAKCYQVCLFFQPIRFVPQTGFHIQHRPTKYFSNLAKVLHIFFALLFVFQNIFKWILFIGCQSFLCPIFLEVLCWFWGKILRLNLLYISTRLKEFPPFPNIYVYNIAFVNSERWLARSRVDITLCQHGKFPATLLLKFFVLYYKRNIKHFFRIDIQLYQRSWKLEKLEIVWKHSALRASCFHTISRFSNLHSCWYNCISTRKMFYIS